MSAIFHQVDNLIDRSLGITHIGSSVPHYRHKSSALGLARKPPLFCAQDLFQAILEQLQQNWKDGQLASPRKASGENWRWEKKLYISPNNKSVEKRCEKAIAATCGMEWVNQVPTASGLVNGSNEKHCNIDLVHRISPIEYEFIELKYADGTPLSAAFEVLKYGLLYVFSRKFHSALGYSLASKPMLAAKTVRLRVLAPASYYSGFQMSWLQSEFNAGLTHVTSSEFEMDFQFETMQWPLNGDCLAAVASRTSVWPWAARLSQ
ncbi:MAG: hypothetical protein CXZ00_02470 [Acidobacteria bacterium]|nr:MAG: hypothetical protein CXZ00_02470 [Acidobacteriota bacterium]